MLNQQIKCLLIYSSNPKVRIIPFLIQIYDGYIFDLYFTIEVDCVKRY